MAYDEGCLCWDGRSPVCPASKHVPPSYRTGFARVGDFDAYRASHQAHPMLSGVDPAFDFLTDWDSPEPFGPADVIQSDDEYAFGDRYADAGPVVRLLARHSHSRGSFVSLTTRVTRSILRVIDPETARLIAEIDASRTYDEAVQRRLREFERMPEATVARRVEQREVPAID